LGTSLDRFFSLGLGAINPLTKEKRQTIFMETIFLLKGKLAKADGHISQDEIRHVEQFMAQLGMTFKHRKKAVNLFKKSSTAGFSIELVLDEFLIVCGHTNNLKQLLLVFLIAMALADGVVDQAEDSLLRTIAARLGFSSIEYERLIVMVKSQSHFAGGGGSATTASDLDGAYSALGMRAQSTDHEIKRAYRKLMSQYHPDKLMGQGVPEDMIQVATEKTQEVQSAYDLIKKHWSRN
tara:strand:+ start:10425 stop:11135 length:711 start_codon:yes stop_codon:yes gene_type:complete